MEVSKPEVLEKVDPVINYHREERKAHIKAKRFIHDTI